MGDTLAAQSSYKPDTLSARQKHSRQILLGTSFVTGYAISLKLLSNA